MDGIWKGGMAVQIMRTVVTVGMTRPARVDNFSGSQNWATIPSLAVATRGAWSARGQLPTHIVGESQATAGASITVSSPQNVQLGGFARVWLILQEIWRIFNLGRFANCCAGCVWAFRCFGIPGVAEAVAHAMRGLGIVRSCGGIVGREIGGLRIALRA